VTGPAALSDIRPLRHGGREALVWRDDLPVPRPGPGEVLVRVLAAGVSASDISTGVGRYGAGEAAGWSGAIGFARIRKSGLCGRVVAPGEGVEGVAPGARVICWAVPAAPQAAGPLDVVAVGSGDDGAFAQYCVVPARHLQQVQASALAEAGAGAMPFACGTAQNLVARARIAVGERVLVTGASGAVGLAAVQLALLRGAEVVAHCPAARAGALRRMGAEVIDRAAVPRACGFDVVIDVAGGCGWQDRLEALRPGGRYVTRGAAGGPEVRGGQRRVYLNDPAIPGAAHRPREVFAGLVTLITIGRLRPVVSKAVPLRDMAAAQADLAAGRYPGKLQLLPQEERA
jgi:NADPH:quinone reductase-like Zn-dependent oxidoreductase